MRLAPAFGRILSSVIWLSNLPGGSVTALQQREKRSFNLIIPFDARALLQAGYALQLSPVFLADGLTLLVKQMSCQFIISYLGATFLCYFPEGRTMHLLTWLIQQSLHTLLCKGQYSTSTKGFSVITIYQTVKFGRQELIIVVSYLVGHYLTSTNIFSGITIYLSINRLWGQELIFVFSYLAITL